MADILAALENLENEERANKNKSKIAASANAKRKTSQSSGRSGRPRTQSVKSSHKKSNSDDLDNLPPPVIGTGRLTPIPKHRPTAPSPSRSRESSVGGDSRRISFAEPARPTARRLYIPTKTASLASGFGYDPKLQKYGVMEGEWAEFSDEVVDAANVPTPTWAWFMHKKEVTRRIKKELQYEGDFKRVLRKWNKHFKRKGFQAWLELPIAKGEPMRSHSAEPAGDSSDEDKVQSKKDEKKNSKRFRMVVSSNVEKGSSVYSRTSSLTRSVSREGVNLQHRAAQKAHEKATEHAAEQDTEGRSRANSAEDKEVGQVVKIDTVDSEDKENNLVLDKGDNVDKEDNVNNVNNVDKVESTESKTENFENFDSVHGVDHKQEEEQEVEKEENAVKDDKDGK